MANTFVNIPDSTLKSPTFADLPDGVAIGTLAITLDSTDIYVYDGSTWNLKGSGGTGILSLNGQTGNSQSFANGSSGTSPAISSGSDIHTLNVPLASGVGVTSGTISKTEYDKFDNASNLVTSGTPNLLSKFDSSGDLTSVVGFEIDSSTGGLEITLTEEPNGVSGSFDLNNNVFDFQPLQNSPEEIWNIYTTNVNLDNNNSGFEQGTNGTAIKVYNTNINNINSGNIGEINFINNNFNLGNGSDPISVNGISYAYGFGQVNANVTVEGQIQGYGFQPNINSAATINNSIVAFYDASNISSSVEGYTSINLGPAIDDIKNNNNYTGINLNSNISSFSGNAGYTGIAVSGTLGTFNTGSVQGINFNSNIDDINSITGIASSPTVTTNVDNFQAFYSNPNISNVQSTATGLFIDMSNITGYAGTQSSLVIQDLTYTFNAVGDNDVYTLEYTTGGTAGSEVVSLSGTDITIQIQSGVSTATQIKAAVDGTSGINAAITVTISGVGSNAQVADGPDNFTGGTNAANIKAIDVTGDVNIQGDLSFTGALSIGKIEAFASQALVNGGGTPSSVHSLITQLTAANNATVANADTLGVNTAALINIGNNATITTSFLGVAALGLPAVITLGTGTTVDRIAGAVFALSLDSAASGGTIEQLYGCRSLVLPNASTTTDRLYAYEASLPFGSVATDEWGIYLEDITNNWIEGSLKIGGTTISNDKVPNSSVALEIDSTTKAFLNARMTTVQKNALTALDGMQVYDTDLNKLQVYSSGSWISLH